MQTLASRKTLGLLALILVCGTIGCGVSYHPSGEQNGSSAVSPVISCSANPTSVLSGGIAQVSAKAVSPLSLPITFSFSASAGTISSQGGLATLNTQGASGTIIVNCKAVDTQGNSASVTTLILIETAPSQAPVISCSADPTTVAMGGSVSLTAIASSPEGSPLTYTWSASSGSISSKASTATLNTNGVATGLITVTCGVTDDQGLTTSATTSVTVTAPASPPPIISCSANPSTVVVGGMALLMATATSPEGRPLTYSWSATSGAISGTASTATLNTAGAPAGTITVTCKVADDQGRSASATTTVTVSAAAAPPPTISCSVNPSIINQGGTAIITAAGQSPDKLALTYSFSTSAGSVSGSGTTGTLETSGLSAGFVTVTCTADQQGGATASATTQVLLQSVTGEQALSAFQFTDSVGVNMHLAYGNSVYATQFPAILGAMSALGINHFRDGLNQYALPFQYENAETLGKAGMKANWLIDIHDTAAIINSAYANAPDATAAFEGPNEDDADAGATLSAFMQLLHDTVRANPGTANMPILAPSFTQPASFATQGNLASLVTNGNTHDYFGNRNPETAPYGGSFYNCGNYGSMQFNICLSQMVGVNEPVISTETGYASGTGLPDAIIGRYELRILFQSLSLGIPRTYLYELVDDPSSLNYGLLNTSFAPRPAYTAIKNTMALLKDASFAQPGKLDYTLTGETQNLYHVLLQKNDGTLYLAIWLGVQGADPNNPSDTFNVAPQSVVLTATTPIASSALHLLDDTGNMTASPTQSVTGPLTISVTDRVSVIALTLGQAH